MRMTIPSWMLDVPLNTIVVLKVAVRKPVYYFKTELSDYVRASEYTEWDSEVK